MTVIENIVPYRQSNIAIATVILPGYIMPITVANVITYHYNHDTLSVQGATMFPIRF